MSQNKLEQNASICLLFQVLALCFYDQHSTEARAAEAGWGAGRCVVLGAGSVNQVLNNITLLLLKMFFLNLVELGLFCSVVWRFFLFYIILLQCGFAVLPFVEVLTHPYKYALFPFQCKSKESWASTGPVPLLGCPAAPG